MKSSNIGKFVHIKKLCNDQGHLQMLALIKDHQYLI